MEATAYAVKIAVFEGPLETLLRLIEERKLFINEISLAQVANDYIAHARSLEGYGLAQATGFLVIAATLLLIKSKSLLPQLSLTDEEKGQITDLESRLRMYQIVKDVGVFIKEQFGDKIIFMAGEREQIPVFSPDESIAKDNIFYAIQNVLEALPKKEIMPEVEIKKVISIEEMISNLIDRVQEGIKLSFNEFSKSRTLDTPKEERVHIIVSFLAILELSQQGIIDIIQNNHFEDIIIEKQAINTIESL